jgi:hypothetical protein
MNINNKYCNLCLAVRYNLKTFDCYRGDVCIYVIYSVFNNSALHLSTGPQPLP